MLTVPAIADLGRDPSMLAVGAGLGLSRAKATLGSADFGRSESRSSFASPSPDHGSADAGLTLKPCPGFCFIMVEYFLANVTSEMPT